MRLKLNQIFQNIYFFPFICWGIFNVFLFFQNGIISDGEALKYLWAANHLFSGEVFPKYLFYSTYVFILALVKSEIAIVVLQILTSGLSLFLFIKGAERVGGKGLLAGILLAVCWPIQYWNTAIYTESFFISGLIILWYLALARKWKWFLAILFPMLFLRPVMVVLLVPFIFWTVFDASRRWKVLMLVGMISLGFLGLLSRIYFFPEYFDFVVTNQVICEVESGASVFVIMGKKLLYFFTLYRPHYSWVHNVANLIYPALLIWGLVKLKRPLGKHQRFLLVFLIWVAVFTLFTCVNWNNRFIAPVLPFVILLFVSKRDLPQS